MNYSIFKSRTFWSVLVLGIYNTLMAVAAIHPASWIDITINALGIVLATYYHVNPSQNYGVPSTTI